MSYIADVFLGAGALAAAFYCLVLSRRLSNLTRLDQDLGAAIAVLSKQVDEMTSVLGAAQAAATASTTALDSQTHKAEQAASRLEVLVAALNDLPETPPIHDSNDTAPLPEKDTAPSRKKTDDSPGDLTLFRRHAVERPDVST